MRIWILALLPCALAAQIAPPRPADQNVFRKLPQRLAWLQAAAAAPQPEWKLGFASPRLVLPGGSVTVAASSGVCSIPLLRAEIPKGVVDRIYVPAPSGKDSDPRFLVPAPAVCGDWKP